MRPPMTDFSQLTTGFIREKLTGSTKITEDLPGFPLDSDFSKAAVLIPFIRDRQQWHLLFIRRARHEDDYHSGQVAFAGGKHEPGDRTLQVTALREAQEEIGLLPEHVSVLGQLNYHHSISRFRIRPVVAHIPWPYELTLDQQEVSRAFTIPLSWLANPDNHRVEEREVEGFEPFPVVWFDEYDGEQLWGATARMTLSLISLLR